MPVVKITQRAARTSWKWTLRWLYLVWSNGGQTELDSGKHCKVPREKARP